jgi:4-carboxymuconolactone decarboxylase
MNDATPDLPSTFNDFVARYPEIEEARAKIARHVEESGPLDRRTCELIRLGIAVGAGFATATRSHAGRAQDLGADVAEIEQAVFLGVNMIGLPRTIMAWQAVRDGARPPSTPTS